MEELCQVLLLEDDIYHKELIDRVFDSFPNFNIIWKPSLKEAEEFLDSNHVDIILSDWKLPDGTGLDIVNKYSHYPIVLMSGYGNEELAVKSIKSGVIDYFVKSTENLLNLPLVLTKALREWKNMLSLISAEKALKLSEERYRLALEGSNDIIWDLDLMNDSLFLSDKIGDYLDCVESQKIKSMNDFLALIHPNDINHFKTEFDAHSKNDMQPFCCEFRISSKNSQTFWFLAKGKALKNSFGEFIRIAGSLTEITERKLYEEKIEYLAYFDTVTNLPNRTSLYRSLEKIINSCETVRGFSVYHIDLDDFMLINDMYGHNVGDILLKKLSIKLHELCNEKIELFRVGGDEFIYLYNIASNMKGLSDFADVILNKLNEEIIAEGSIFSLLGSIGIASFPTDGPNISDLLKNADTALYKAKDFGKNRYCFFNSKMKAELKEKMELDKMLKQALENKEFVLYYQPQIDLFSGKLYGFEALIRWNSAEYGLIPPSKFIKIAEESGLIIQIGQWVWETSCKFAKKLYDTGHGDLHVSINVSSLQLNKRDIVKNFKKAMDEYKIPTNMLSIEITESTMLESFDSSIEKLNAFRKMGLKIQLDDFGTGYSSLNYLNLLPIDVVKIDKSFIDHLANQGNQGILTKTIIHLSHELGLKVIAEGVENKEQMEILSMHNCDIIQGFYLSKPLPENEIQEFLVR